MKNIALILLCAALLAACRENGRPPEPSDLSLAGLRLLPEDNPDGRCGSLRLYPVVAENDADGNASATLKTLAEGMVTPGFRITERKAFGRTRGATINELTVQNRGRDTIFLMAGDVVTGGNQDRVIARDELVLPGTVRNIEVFCVEKDRWSYYDTAATEADRQVGAFRGYFHVASPTVRRALHRDGGQQAVWSAVAQVTAANEAASATSTYAALDRTENERRERREACAAHLRDPWPGNAQVVGVVAVSGERVLGVDIFGHADLFRRQFPALLHGYVADAATDSAAPTGEMTAHAVEAFRDVARLAASGRKSSDAAGRFNLPGTPDSWVHLYSK
jgi:peptidoglycan hydrolase-like protein with peptidoglycan-binding domain